MLKAEFEEIELRRTHGAAETRTRLDQPKHRLHGWGAGIVDTPGMSQAMERGAAITAR